MTDDKKTTPPKPSAPGQPGNRIPVARLAFTRAGGVDLFKSPSLPAEKRNGMTSVEAGPIGKSAARFEIAFYPALQHHRVVLYPASGAPETVMVPAEWCHWTPAEE